MEQILEYVKPELLVLIPVLYFIGQSIKKSETVENKYIPMTLNVIGIGLAAVYVAGVSGISTMGVFTAIVQGVLCAGAAVNLNETLKQSEK